jgi:hypothetical protein
VAPPPAPPSRLPPPEIGVGVQPPGLDAKRWRELRRGGLKPQRKLDLHGMTAARAHEAVRGFLLSAQAEGARVVCIVTGKGSTPEGGVLRLEALLSWIRHDKGGLVAEALAPLPDARFALSRAALVARPFVPGVGTEYAPALARAPFHVNAADGHGNTLLTVAAQNNRLRCAQLLLRKGAHADHQNAQGNTAMHFAMAYKVHDLAAWLVDPEKGGAADDVRNAHGLDPYEGLTPD